MFKCLGGFAFSFSITILPFDNMTQTALITGVTGQDGSYLAELLLDKGYQVHGLKRSSSVPNSQRVAHLNQGSPTAGRRFVVHHGDLTDSSRINELIRTIKPDEIYNLAAQSHVAVSFQQPEHTADADALGTLRILEAIRNNSLVNKSKFYQASTSELFGKAQQSPQTETSPFYPRSPYAVAKLFSYWTVVNYREAYNIFACNGILFNHESPRRGETFVTRKITRALARIFYGLQDCLYLGNLNAKRDWGHARDYVEMQWLMLQQQNPDDYVIATGQQHSVRCFVETAAENLGITITWKGNGRSETGVIAQLDSARSEGSVTPGQTIIRIDPCYYRPTEVENLLGNSAKAKKILGWAPKTSFKSLVKEMVTHDLELAKKDLMCREKGYQIFNFME